MPRLSSQEKTRKLFTLGIPGSRHCGHESRRNGAARDCDNSPLCPSCDKRAPCGLGCMRVRAYRYIYIYLPRKPRKSIKTRDINHFRGGGTPVPPPLRRLKTRINQRESSSRARARKEPQGKPSGGGCCRKSPAGARNSLTLPDIPPRPLPSILRLLRGIVEEIC